MLTGGPLGPEIGAVVMEDKASINGYDVSLPDRLSPGLNVRRQGEDVDMGETILPKGTVIDARHVALLAASGVVR